MSPFSKQIRTFNKSNLMRNKTSQDKTNLKKVEKEQTFSLILVTIKEVQSVILQDSLNLRVRQARSQKSNNSLKSLMVTNFLWLTCLEFKESYYFLYQYKPHGWWTFTQSLDFKKNDDKYTQFAISIHILFNMLSNMQSGLENSVRRKKQDAQFSKSEINQILND